MDVQGYVPYKSTRPSPSIIYSAVSVRHVSSLLHKLDLSVDVLRNTMSGSGQDVHFSGLP